MSTLILGVSDPHLSDRRPSGRRDEDWFGTLRAKLGYVRRLAHGCRRADGRVPPADAVVIAGDLFHVPRGPSIRRTLERNLLPAFLDFAPTPVLAIAGNHDILHDRAESLDDHPYGVFAAAGAIRDVDWPESFVVGDDPPVVVLGRRYVPEGPGPWLDGLRVTGAVRELLARVSAERGGRRCYAYAMTHWHWGQEDGTSEHGTPVLGIRRLAGTGIDVCQHGDEHSARGQESFVDADGRTVSNVGPGALVRGTLSDADVARKPQVSAVEFFADGTHAVSFVTIPHRPAAEAFDAAAHVRAKRERKREERFVESLRALGAGPAEALAPLLASAEAPAKVKKIAMDYCDQAAAAPEPAGDAT